MESKRRTAPTKLAVKGHYNYKAPLDGAEMMAANPYRPWSARITSMTPLTEKETLFELRLIDDRIRDAFHHKPGQFVCVSVFGVGEGPIHLIFAFEERLHRDLRASCRRCHERAP